MRPREGCPRDEPMGRGALMGLKGAVVVDVAEFNGSSNSCIKNCWRFLFKSEFHFVVGSLFYNVLIIFFVIVVRFFFSVFQPLNEFLHLFHKDSPSPSRMGLLVPFQYGIFRNDIGFVE